MADPTRPHRDRTDLEKNGDIYLGGALTAAVGAGGAYTTYRTVKNNTVFASMLTVPVILAGTAVGMFIVYFQTPYTSITNWGKVGSSGSAGGVWVYED